MNVNVLKRRWNELEKRSSAVYSIMSELEVNFKDYMDANIEETTAYLLLQQEAKLLSKEQEFIERSGALAHVPQKPPEREYGASVESSVDGSLFD